MDEPIVSSGSTWVLLQDDEKSEQSGTGSTSQSSPLHLDKATHTQRQPISKRGLSRESTPRNFFLDSTNRSRRQRSPVRRRSDARTAPLVVDSALPTESFAALIPDEGLIHQDAGCASQADESITSQWKAGFAGVLSELKVRHADLLSKRENLHAMRKAWEQIERKSIKHDVKFMREAERVLKNTSTPAATTLQDRFKALRQTNNAAPPYTGNIDQRLEHRFTKLHETRAKGRRIAEELKVLEIDIIKDEVELQELYANLQAEGESLLRGVETRYNPQAYGEPAVRVDSSHAEIYEAIDEVEFVKEQLADLRVQRAHLVQESLTRQELGFRLDDASEDFLQNFDFLHSELVAELNEAESRLQHLRQSLQLHTMVEEENEPLQERNPVGDDPKPETTGSTRPSPPVFGRQHYSATVLDAIGGFMSDSTFTYDRIGSMTDTVNTELRINLWLLNSTKALAEQLEQYTNALLAQPILLSTTELQEMFSQFWFKDGTERQYVEARDRANRDTIHLSIQTEQRQSSKPRSEPSVRIRRKLVPTTPDMRTSTIIAHVRRRRMLSPTRSE